jgi:hypothetical protein
MSQPRSQPMGILEHRQRMIDMCPVQVRLTEAAPSEAYDHSDPDRDALQCKSVLAPKNDSISATYFAPAIESSMRTPLRVEYLARYRIFYSPRAAAGGCDD